MAKQFIVTRGQIEKGKSVLAKEGQIYKPKNKAEEDRLLEAGVIGEAPSASPAAEPEPEPEPGVGKGGE
ncbi:hypothetical protein NYA30BAC_01980 [Halomonas sp. NYA30]